MKTVNRWFEDSCDEDSSEMTDSFDDSMREKRTNSECDALVQISEVHFVKENSYCGMVRV